MSHCHFSAESFHHASCDLKKKEPQTVIEKVLPVIAHLTLLLERQDSKRTSFLGLMI